MTTAQILYGLRNNELVHVDDVERGLACGCTCAACGRPLVAKKGEVLCNFFAHDADESNCNPTPESLVHRYAKQQVSKLLELRLPGFEVRAEFESKDGHLHELYWRHHPYYLLAVKSATVEADLGSIKPDVLFQTKFVQVAVEVYFRHQVPPEKIHLLREQYLSAVEIDLSNLPIDSSARTIHAAINDVRRWKWLHNQHEIYLRQNMASLLARSTKIFVPNSAQTTPRTSMAALPSRKLANADKLLLKAKRLATDLKQMPVPIRIQHVRHLENELRVALYCHQIEVHPTRLPRNLMQAVDGQGALGMHPLFWQTGVFAKFCMVGSEFSAKSVETWVRTTVEDEALDRPENMTQSTNGFSAVAEALYHFLRNLSAQGLLREIKGKKPWESTFAPVAPSKREVVERLLLLPAALSEK